MVFCPLPQKAHKHYIETPGHQAFVSLASLHLRVGTGSRKCLSFLLKFRVKLESFSKKKPKLRTESGLNFNLLFSISETHC